MGLLYNESEQDKGCDFVPNLHFHSTHTMISDVSIEAGLFAHALTRYKDDAIWFYDQTLPNDYIDDLIEAIDPSKRFGLPPREPSKSLLVYEEMITFLDHLKPARSTTIVALGGGALCDAVAFLASTYLRGLPLVLVPTTLLGMVDAAVGGKTALNTQFKNRIGTFYPAKTIVVDPTFLKTLNPSLMGEGMSEIIKVALLFDATFVDALEQNTLNIETIIERAIALKIACASKDVTDHGQRQLLNFGHTIGHALESVHHYHYPHGQCVGAGMVLMTQDQPFGPRVRALLEQYDAFRPISYEKDALVPLILGDKKRHGKTLTYVRLKAIGEGVLKTIDLTNLAQIIPEDYV